jgi:hypothetical protein
MMNNNKVQQINHYYYHKDFRGVSVCVCVLTNDDGWTRKLKLLALL